jgi:hypothetical protein
MKAEEYNKNVKLLFDTAGHETILDIESCCRIVDLYIAYKEKEELDTVDVDGLIYCIEKDYPTSAYRRVNHFWEKVFEEKIPQEVDEYLEKKVLEYRVKEYKKEKEARKKEEEFLNKKPSEMTAKELLEFERRLESVREKKSVCKKCDGRGDMYTENDWGQKTLLVGTCSACDGKGY